MSKFLHKLGRPFFPNQDNPQAVQFGSVEYVAYNEGYFSSLNRGTKSVSYIPGPVTLSYSNIDWPTVESIARKACISAVYSMRRIAPEHSDLEARLPSVTGVLLAYCAIDPSMKPGYRTWVHSSVIGGRKATSKHNIPQAKLHPKLQARIEKMGIVHHFSSWCAEMALLTNFLHEYPDALGEEGPLLSEGQPVRIMTYNSTLFPKREGEVERDGTGYYLVPCQHVPAKCGKRKRHFGNGGCYDILEELGVEVIPRGSARPSEEDEAVLAEQEDE